MDLQDILYELAEFLHNPLRDQWGYSSRILLFRTVPTGVGAYGEVVTTVYHLEKE
jgi:hypothetical protein